MQGENGRPSSLQMQAVASTNLEAVGYDAETSTLRIEFASGSVYDYHGVPPAVAQALIEAPSKGIYFSKAIKPAYLFQRVS